MKIAEENTTVRDCKIGRETLPAKGDSSRAAKVNIADTKVRSDDDASSLMIQSRETASHPGQTKISERCYAVGRLQDLHRAWQLKVPPTTIDVEKPIPNRS